MTVRAAGDGDGPVLAGLRWAWRVDELGETPNTERATFIDSFAAWFDAHRDSHAAWLASAGDVAVGMVFLAVLERPPGPARLRRAGGLQSLYVLPSHRSGGHGSALIQAVLDEASRRRLDYVFLHPTERSIPLYRRFGFHDTGRTYELTV